MLRLQGCGFSAVEPSEMQLFRTYCVSPRNLGVLFKLLPRKKKQQLLSAFLSLDSWFGFYLVKDRAIPSPRLLNLQRRANWGIKGNPSFQVTMAPAFSLGGCSLQWDRWHLPSTLQHFTRVSDSCTANEKPNAIVETPRLRNTAGVYISELPGYLRLKTMWPSSEWEKQSD